MKTLVTTKMVKVSLDLEEELHKAIRKKAIDKGITMKAHIIELIEKGKRVEETGDIEKTEEQSATVQASSIAGWLVIVQGGGLVGTIQTKSVKVTDGAKRRKSVNVTEIIQVQMHVV